MGNDAGFHEIELIKIEGINKKVMDVKMAQKNLKSFFQGFLNKERFFVDKKVLQVNYSPPSLVHRDEQINQIASILAPALNFEKPSNIFIYGKTGTGKTVSVRHTLDELTVVANEQKIALKTVYINCKLKRVADTEYRLVSTLIKELDDVTIPFTGLPTDEVYRIFYDILEKKKVLLILVLDEIDQIVKKTGDELLYNLTRINSELKQSIITIVGISNDLMFVDTLDARIKSSLGEEEMVFPPYDATQIKDILSQRSKIAFRLGVIGEGVIEKCAAFAAREHGDARRAIDLLRIAAELAERDNKEKVSVDYIDIAENKLESDKTLDMVSTQPKHFQCVLYSVISCSDPKSSVASTGSVYDYYVDVCKKTGLRPLTQRRVSGILAELEMLGLINSKVVSKGRAGRTRELKVSIPYSLLGKTYEILKKSLGL